MSPTPPSATGNAERLGLKPGMIVMEAGYDDDVDEQLRDDIAEYTGEELVDDDTDEVVDVVLLWFREGDGDLADTLVDSISPLADDGYIWLLTPKRGRAGLRRAVRHRRGGLDRRAVPDLDHDRRAGLVRGPAARPPLGRIQALTRTDDEQAVTVGDVAPDFSLHDQNNEQITLSQYRGTKAVLIDLLSAGVHRRVYRRAVAGAR